MDTLYVQTLKYLRQALGNAHAQFQDDQWEAIQALVQQRSQLLVVQRTGWGKSMVYFLATRLLRDQGMGPTLLVSPLLALMRNQLDAARRIGLSAVKIDSSNTTEWPGNKAKLLRNEADILLISPERLSNEEFRNEILARITPGLFVVDEAHCISDWGHDFRPDYRRITRILQMLPANVPVLATTATANNRVVDDVNNQLGGRLQIIRGPLIRDSLHLQAIALPHQATRLAWLAEQVPRLPGSGIIYARTKRDIILVVRWLNEQGISAAGYYSGDENRELLEQQLLDNEINVLVATSALGMGFDKPDLRFVIHYQRPGSVVDYYQQVGRAGRNGSSSCGVMLCGKEDHNITDYFISTAFPPAAHVESLLTAIDDSAQGLSVPDLEKQLNLSKGQIDKVIKLLDVLYPSPIDKIGTKYFRTATPWQPDTELEKRLNTLRHAEKNQIDEYAEGSQCLMNFLRSALDDPAITPCGKCTFCRGRDLLPVVPSDEMVRKAIYFLKNSNLPIEPRKQWRAGNRIPINQQHEPGRALSVYGDAGWGELVKQGKYETDRFDDALVEAAAEMIRQRWQPVPFPTWVTAVPSLKRPALVPDFAQRLAARLGLPYHATINKVKDNGEQKYQQNNHFRLLNLTDVFAVNLPAEHTGQPVLLVDDMVDSKWTFTILASLLNQAGCGAVFPFALAQSSTDDE